MFDYNQCQIVPILIIYDIFDTLICVGAYSSRAYGIDVVEIN